jgi:hypothetical protein
VTIDPLQIGHDVVDRTPDRTYDDAGLARSRGRRHRSRAMNGVRELGGLAALDVTVARWATW